MCNWQHGAHCRWHVAYWMRHSTQRPYQRCYSRRGWSNGAADCDWRVFAEIEQRAVSDRQTTIQFPTRHSNASRLRRHNLVDTRCWLSDISRTTNIHHFSFSVALTSTDLIPWLNGIRTLFPKHIPPGQFPLPDNSPPLFTWCRIFPIFPFHRHHQRIYNIKRSIINAYEIDQL